MDDNAVFLPKHLTSEIIVVMPADDAGSPSTSVLAAIKFLTAML